MLKRHTLFPGDDVEGFVIAKANSRFMKRVEVVIPFGEDVHRIFFHPEKLKTRKRKNPSFKSD